MADVGIACGGCGGPMYVETCEMNGGPKGHEFAVAIECQDCGTRSSLLCAECCPLPGTAGGE